MYFLYIYIHIFSLYMYIYMYMYIYKGKTYIKNIYIYIFIYTQSILVFDTKPVLYRPVLDQIQFCSLDRRCKTCLDTKSVLYQGRFCSLTYARMPVPVNALLVTWA